MGLENALVRIERGETYLLRVNRKCQSLISQKRQHFIQAEVSSLLEVVAICAKGLGFSGLLSKDRHNIAKQVLKNVNLAPLKF